MCIIMTKFNVFTEKVQCLWCLELVERDWLIGLKPYWRFSFRDSHSNRQYFYERPFILSCKGWYRRHKHAKQSAHFAFSWPSKLRNDFACQVTTISCKLFIFSASTFKNWKILIFSWFGLKFPSKISLKYSFTNFSIFM